MIRLDGARLVLDGDITLASHGHLRTASASWLAAGDLEADWRGVDTVDSSALSLILHWTRELAHHGHALTHRGLPPALLALADLYGVKDLLGESRLRDL